MNSMNNTINLWKYLRELAELPKFTDQKTRNRKPNEKRECLNCDKLHNHNNSFCSPKCCKEHKDK